MRGRRIRNFVQLKLYTAEHKNRPAVTFVTAGRFLLKAEHIRGNVKSVPWALRQTANVDRIAAERVCAAKTDAAQPECDFLTRAVFSVAEKRHLAGGKLNSYLMRSARMQLYKHKGGVIGFGKRSVFEKSGLCRGA